MVITYKRRYTYSRLITPMKIMQIIKLLPLPLLLITFVWRSWKIQGENVIEKLGALVKRLTDKRLKRTWEHNSHYTMWEKWDW